MYLNFYGFRTPPFDNVPDPAFFYASRPHREGLARILYAVQMRKGAALLAGDIGSGKTTVSSVFLKKLPNQEYKVALISNPCSDPVEFLQDVAFKFNIEPVPSNKVEILRLLNSKLVDNIKKDYDNILIIDEAQLLDVPTLEEVRLLLNFQLPQRFLLTIILLGQPDLMKKIKNMKQLSQRIGIKYILEPLNLEDTIRYILRRQKVAGAKKNVFSKKAIEIIYEYSDGLPRNINNICDLSLMVGFTKKKPVTSDIVKMVLEDGNII